MDTLILKVLLILFSKSNDRMTFPDSSIGKTLSTQLSVFFESDSNFDSGQNSKERSISKLCLRLFFQKKLPFFLHFSSTVCYLDCAQLSKYDQINYLCRYFTREIAFNLDNNFHFHLVVAAVGRVSSICIYKNLPFSGKFSFCFEMCSGKRSNFRGNAMMENYINARIHNAMMVKSAHLEAYYLSMSVQG